MQKQNQKNKKSRFKSRFFVSITTWLLLFTLIVQVMPVTVAAAFGGSLNFGSNGSLNLNGVSSGIGIFKEDEALAQFKKSLISSLNQDLLMKVEDYKLSGEVDVILSFSDDSLVSAYSKTDKDMTFEEYRGTKAAKKLYNKIAKNQSDVLEELTEKGLISDVMSNYYHILDGAFVSTTFEQLDELCKVEGVGRIMVSNTYLPAVAVENPVNVYDTGIFNSSDVSFTGKGTIVAILDTGCDYTHSAFTTHQVVSPLYDRDDIAALLPKTVAYSYDTSVEAREVYYGNITGEKIVYGYDYADKDPDVMPFSNEHGTHVAGIIGGMDDTITGVAIDTQLAIMKVFSDYATGAKDGWIMAALEDSVILGVDAINMSLGTSCGFSREVDEEFKNEIYDSIERAGISLVVAASNDYSSAYGSEQGNTNKTDNPDSATVGSPSTYDAAMSVASINGEKDMYMFANGDREVFFHESVNMSAKEYDFFDLLGINADNPVREFEYVTIPGVGMAINYAGLDMQGKIALVKRGEISFEEKIQFAHEAGAIAVIVYNNVFGDIVMTIGNDAKIPAVSIGKDDGEVLAAKESGTIKFDFNNQAGPFMSGFSSWGPTPSLGLKPEITAHGGNILSAILGGGYEKLSGTSMAAPNMCGITVLIRQYVKEKYPNMTATEVRDLVNQLCMSTATIAMDQVGNPYSPRKQGAGIADIRKATTTSAYLYVEGIGKTKLELGDDPSRKGVYTMTLSIKNISDKAVSYRLGNITMTESLSTSDPEYVAERGYLLSNGAEYSVAGDGSLENGVVSVPAGKTATVTVTLTLSSADKSYLNANFANGMFVEGFITFDNTEENGIDLNAPFLAFYGDWGEAPIFDLDFYEVETEAHNDAIDDDDKIKADYYATLPAGNYYYDYILPLGSYLYKMDEEEYTPISATQDKAAVSYYKTSISGIYGVIAGLLRGAKELNITIKNTATNEIVWSDTQYNCYKAHFAGAPRGYFAEFDLPMVNTETNEIFGYNNTKFEVTMNAKLDWDGGKRNSNDTYTFTFYIDYEAPTITDAIFRTEYDKTEKKNRYYVDAMVYDNHYAMTLRPVILFDTVDDDGKPTKTFSSLCEYPIPVYQENLGEVTKVSVEITDYLDLIRSSSMPEGISFYLEDYALNSGVCYVPFPESENSELEFITPTMDMDIGQTFDLTTYLARSDNGAVEADYLKNLTWSSSDESVVAIHNGMIETKKSGSATVSVTASTWKCKEGDKVTDKPLYKTIVINVSDKMADDPNSSANVKIESLEFTSYKTLFAFNNDIDFSKIGVTDSTNYFGGNPSIEFYPSEKIQLFYTLNPWNIDSSRYTLKWSSSNPKIATVDENGVVTAESEGKARITLQITIDGKTSLLAARCSVEVKSEFIIENRTLVAYKGKGGDVVIPDDEGIMTIGSYAFSHFNLDNDREVEKDEDGYYDIDDKKDALGNDTVTSVVIPDGVETISKHAFYKCEKLSDVTLPETCKTIEEYAFYECELLENINFDKVQVISDYAFYHCDSLTCDDLGGVNLSNVSTIGDYAFAGSRLKAIELSNLRRSGKGVFSNCSRLESVVLGKTTRISEKMFEGSAVTSVVVYSDIISDYAFKDCKKLTSVKFCNDLTYLGVEAFKGCNKLSSVVFDGVCEEIASNAFDGCKTLSKFTLPSCDVVLGAGVFSGSGLKELVFDKNTYFDFVGVGIFDNISKGMQLTVSDSEHYKMVDGILYTKDGSVLVFVTPGARLGDFVVPASVKEIAAGAFSATGYLTSITFEAGSKLERIGYGAFSNCNVIRSVKLPANSIEIDGMAFYQATLLREINLENVVSIGDYAFENTALSSVILSKEGVKIGKGVFQNCSNLVEVTLPKNTFIGSYAFRNSVLWKVNLGGNITVGTGAFYNCTRLTEVDFTKFTGKLGNYAFFNCESLTSINMPNVTEIGECCFAECSNIVELKAEKLEVIGKKAFSTEKEGYGEGAKFKKVTLPKLRSVGESAFYACVELTEIDLSGVTSIGKGAFAYCLALKSVKLSENLKDLPDIAFYNCKALSDINLENVVSFGMGVLYRAPLPAHLELTKAEHIGSQAFVEAENENYLVSVNAPNLIRVDDQAFAACKKLKTVTAPKLEQIAFYAFAYTAIDEFEIGSSLKSVEYSIFEGTDIVSFFAMVDGKKVYDYEFETVMIKDGVLYTNSENGYVLSIYPSGREDKEFTVADGTVRIEYTAAMYNKHLEKVILPESLRYIGNFAFYGCDNLKTVVFKSYYAPTLEGTITGKEIKITPDNVGDYPGFDKLYNYDYYYREKKEVSRYFYYMNFIDLVTSTKAVGITYVIPENCEGYDSIIYKAYFDPSEETSGVAVGKFALAFIDAAKKLPETADRFDKVYVDAAINAYNALEGHADELALVDEALIQRFLKTRSEYYISVAENKIDHLFDMDRSEYSFELVKDARATYMALTAEEQALVSNADKLTAKITELTTAMGKDVNFDISFSDHFPAEPPIDPPTIVDPPVNNNAGQIVMIVAIVAVSAAVIAAAVIIFIKKKRTV